jgi:hypothetical protein
MLLIAQPKSASTSLMWTLAHILKIAHKNGQNRLNADKKCPGFEELQKYHGTTVKRNYAFLYNYICKPDVIYKEHILPIDKHIEFIKDIDKPVVVLLRDADQTIESYKRVFSVLPELKIDYNKLKNNLEEFQFRYIMEAENNKPLGKPHLFKIITFKDITKNFTETIKSVIMHYGKEVPEDIEKYKLCKRNYTYR